ncbi:MAG: FCD domain-containing protein [Planctomycetes bacterium]|nr:FCD domain-containing protein [Planctomycetota bacterium]
MARKTSRAAQKPVDRQRMHLADVDFSDELFKNLGLGGRRELDRECISLLDACLDHERVTAKQLGVAPDTLERISLLKTRIELGTLCRVFIRLGIEPGDLIRHKLNEHLAHELVSLRESILILVEVIEYDPASPLARAAREPESPLWRQIVERATNAMRGVLPPADHPPPDISTLEPVPSNSVPGLILKLVTASALKPGERIVKEHVRVLLKDKFGVLVNLDEIYLALRLLTMHGYVVSNNDVTYSVRELTPDEWREVIEYRKSIESLNVQRLLVCNEECVSAVAELRARCQQMESALANNDVADFIHADIKFHCELAGWSRVRHRIMRAVLPSVRHVGARLGRPDIMAQLLRDHQAILESVSVYNEGNVILAPEQLVEFQRRATEAICRHLDNALKWFTDEPT